MDVEAGLTRLAAQKKEKLDWRHSIVLELGSSLSARDELKAAVKKVGNSAAAVEKELRK